MKLGDQVCWISQANGRAREKFGQIVEVVPAGTQPSRDRFPGLYRGPGVGGCRNHESYVIALTHSRKDQKPLREHKGTTHFWPIAKKVKLQASLY